MSAPVEWSLEGSLVGGAHSPCGSDVSLVCRGPARARDSPLSLVPAVLWLENGVCGGGARAGALQQQRDIVTPQWLLGVTCCSQLKVSSYYSSVVGIQSIRIKVVYNIF